MVTLKVFAWMWSQIFAQTSGRIIFKGRKIYDAHLKGVLGVDFWEYFQNTLMSTPGWQKLVCT